MQKTRIPTQKRSLEKYEKILAASSKLFNEKGYFNTTTTDIAKESGVAVGSIYSYFLDKKEIYIEISNRNMKRFTEPAWEYWKNNILLTSMDEDSIKRIFKIFVEIMMKEHDFTKIYHDDINALKLLDKEIGEIEKAHQKTRNDWSKEIMNYIKIQFRDKNSEDIFLHYCNLLIDDICHTLIYEDIEDKDAYVTQAVDLMYNLLQNLADIKSK